MLNPRIIPCLLVKNKGLVKTVKFKDPKYVGDPINAVKIFNEKESDELILLDIDATVDGRGPDYQMIKNIAAECRMPLCYGGGITSCEQASRIFKLGVEKIAISSAACDRPALVAEIANEVGRQSVVVVIDVKKRMFGKYEIFSHNAKNRMRVDLLDFIKEVQEQGVGEIVLNSIDCDGTMQGYDFNLIDKVQPLVHVPLTVLGGAGSFNDFSEAFDRYGILGAAAGSLFVFKGKYRAVLISYPKIQDKEHIFKAYRQSAHIK